MNWHTVNQKHVTVLPANLQHALDAATRMAKQLEVNVRIRDDAAHGIVVTAQILPRRGSHLIGVVTPAGQAIWIESELTNRGAQFNVPTPLARSA